MFEVLRDFVFQLVPKALEEVVHPKVGLLESGNKESSELESPVLHQNERRGGAEEHQ